ncbi:MAG: GntR family transcriptional regulator [Terrimicrobiaceae bacterium]
MLFHLNPSSGVPIYRQMVNQMRERILGGQLSAGEKLPSVRDVSVMSSVNPLTVAKVYQFLEREGLVETRRGTGTFVASRVKTFTAGQRREQLEPLIRQLVAETHHLGLDSEQTLRWVRDEFSKKPP